VESLIELLETGGTIDTVKLVLLIGFIFAVTILVIALAVTRSKNQDNIFRTALLDMQRESSQQFTSSIHELKQEFQRFINVTIENQTKNHEVQVKFMELQEQYIADSRADRTYREGLAKQLSGDMADNQLAIETNTARIMEVKGVTEDRLRQVTERLDVIDKAVTRVEDHLKIMQTGEDTVSGTINELCTEMHEVRELLNRIIQFIENEKQTERSGKE